MKLIYWLAEIEERDRLLVGDKAYGLNYLQRHKYPIINGFVVSSLGLKELLERQLDFDRYKINVQLENPYSLQSFAQGCQEVIFQNDLSSALVEVIAESYQQLQSSHLILRPSLAVKTKTEGLLGSLITSSDLRSVVNTLKKVWAELFTAKSLFYWQKKGIPLIEINLAVLIQPIKSAIASGTVILENQQAQIEAVKGLGHSLVYGELAPDLYHFDLISGKIIAQTSSPKSHAYRLSQKNEQPLESYLLPYSKDDEASLTTEQLGRLTQYLQRLSNELDFQGYLEWTILEDEELYFTQANLYSSIAPHSLRLTGLSASSGQVIASVEVISDLTSNPTFPAKTILVLRQISPAQLPWLTKAVGIITEQGGITSHAAILARELGIPAVVGVAKATKLLKTGESILLDGDTGEVYRLAGSTLPAQYLVKDSISFDTKPTRKEVPLSTQLMVNVSQANSLEGLELLPLLDGVGLLRSESFFAQLWSERPASQWSRDALQERLINFISHFSQLFAQRPVFYRLLDHSDEAVGLARGTYAYLQDPTLLDLQLEAVLEVQKLQNTNINLLLPFVRSVEEFKFAQERVEKIGLRKSSSFELWIMAEVPSILFLLPDYVKAGVQGISIGTNDLAQLLLGFGREVTHIEETTCPKALKQAIQQLIELATSCGIPCSICGQAPLQYLDLIESLVEWGITTISVEPQALRKTYHTIARAEQRLILQAARKILYFNS